VGNFSFSLLVVLLLKSKCIGLQCAATTVDILIKIANPLA
jgi:hypothetical protein